MNFSSFMQEIASSKTIQGSLVGRELIPSAVVEVVSPMKKLGALMYIMCSMVSSSLLQRSNTPVFIGEKRGRRGGGDCCSDICQS